MQLPDAIPYKKLMVHAHVSGRPIDEFLREQLPLFWQDAYDAMLARPCDVMVFTYGTFDYWFDTYQQPVPYDPGAGKLPIEARLVFAIGTSKPKHSRRDDYRLRGMKLSAMPDTHGPWDRGHFVGHAIGGVVDGNEANVFLQLRKTNRGRYRTMELYCRRHAGLLCFSRPVYVDTSAHPAQVDFGILKPDGELWVETMPNR